MPPNTALAEMTGASLIRLLEQSGWVERIRTDSGVALCKRRADGATAVTVVPFKSGRLPKGALLDLRAGTRLALAPTAAQTREDNQHAKTWGSRARLLARDILPIIPSVLVGLPGRAAHQNDAGTSRQHRPPPDQS
jgi:hypothetical protein